MNTMKTGGKKGEKRGKTPLPLRKRINSRSKGIRGERQVIDLMQPVCDQVTAEVCRRNPGVKVAPILLQRNTLQSDRGGSDIAGIPWLALEIKWVESRSLDSWWQQCVRQAGPGQRPVLWYRQRNQPWRVRMMGMLPATSGGRLSTVLVDVSSEDWLAWFQLDFMNRLTGGL